MKRQLAFASLLVLSACGASREALMALNDMNIIENRTTPGVSYKSISGWGDDITLNDVQILAPAHMAAMMAGPPEGESVADTFNADAPPTAVLNAKSMSFRGLTMKDGKPLARDIVLSDLSPATPLPGATVTLGTLGLEGMNEATGRFITGLIGLDEANPAPALDQWAFDRAAIGGLSVAATIPQPPGGEGEPADPSTAGTVNVQLGEISFSNIGGDRLGAARFAGLKGDVNIPGMVPVAGTFDFGDMRLSGIHTKLFVDQIAAVIREETSGEPVDYAALYRDYTSPLEGGIDRVDWTGLAADFSGLKFDTSELHSAVTRNADGVVVASNMDRFTAKLTTDSSGGTLGAMGLMMLAMGGYDSDEIELFFSGGATFDPQKDLTRWVDYNVGVTDFFDVKMSGGVLGLKQALPALMTGLTKAIDSIPSQRIAVQLDDDDASDAEEDVWDEDEESDELDVILPPDGEAGDEDEEAVAEEQDGAGPFGGADPAMVMSLMMGVLPLQLTDLDVQITDRKLVNMILDSQAISAGQSVEDYRADLVSMVSASAIFMADAGVDAAIAQELTAAASGFLAGPGTLHIQLKPKTPLGVMSVMAMPITKESLGFSATFTPAAPAAPATN